jgi:hypothetical protein
MERTIFAMELCFRFDANLHATLREHVKSHPLALGHHEKWVAYRNLESDLLANLERVERGCWDYFNDDQKAKHDYAMWVHGMMTDETARASPSGAGDAYRGEAPRYLTFTIAFLIVQGTPTDSALFQLCDHEQDRLWHRATFVKILQGLGVVNFASVESDLMYLIPRDEDWSLTSEDLSEPKFEYLRPLY